MHSMQENMHYMQGQLDQILQVFQNSATSSEEEGKENAKAIILQFGVVIQESVRPVSEEVREKENSTYTPSVGDGVEESVEEEVKPKQSELKDKLTIPPSQELVPFPTRLEKRKNERVTSFSVSSICLKH
ncbi:hypothetical protein PVK06_001471 [Gossypium arboreum]|uniref:Uncharacterized protein n=1 Tax=Gossypium arboreum TaxID=29729 RepID=A0ABR0R257_GOSAR|nr:hypothetical protein PVK06_001471 [Gossypium arboreum]